MRTLIALILLFPLSVMADDSWPIYKIDDLGGCVASVNYDNGDHLNIVLGLVDGVPSPFLVLGNDKWKLPENVEGSIIINIDDHAWEGRVQYNEKDWIRIRINFEILKKLSLGNTLYWKAGSYVSAVDLKGSKNAIEELVRCAEELPTPSDTNPFKEATETNPFDI